MGVILNSYNKVIEAIFVIVILTTCASNNEKISVTLPSFVGNKMCGDDQYLECLKISKHNCLSIVENAFRNCKKIKAESECSQYNNDSDLGCFANQYFKLLKLPESRVLLCSNKHVKPKTELYKSKIQKDIAKRKLARDSVSFTELLSKGLINDAHRYVVLTKDPKEQNDKFLELLNIATRQKDRYLILTDAIKSMARAKNYTDARNYAIELLDIAKSIKKGWNYGNAIHSANIVLGMVALNSRQLDEAGNFLLDAGKTPGSPQLDTFGPNLMLANELIDVNRKEVVRKYLFLIKSFWDNSEEIDNWISALDDGCKPIFQKIYLIR